MPKHVPHCFNNRKTPDHSGVHYLPETQPWNIEQGGTCYTTRNNSSVIAFKVGTSLDNYHFQITASHGDSPTFKVKSNAEFTG